MKIYIKNTHCFNSVFQLNTLDITGVTLSPVLHHPHHISLLYLMHHYFSDTWWREQSSLSRQGSCCHGCRVLSWPPPPIASCSSLGLPSPSSPSQRSHHSHMVMIMLGWTLVSNHWYCLSDPVTPPPSCPPTLFIVLSFIFYCFIYFFLIVLSILFYCILLFFGGGRMKDSMSYAKPVFFCNNFWYMTTADCIFGALSHAQQSGWCVLWGQQVTWSSSMDGWLAQAPVPAPRPQH